MVIDSMQELVLNLQESIAYHEPLSLCLPPCSIDHDEARYLLLNELQPKRASLERRHH
jgi:hypothetical protein